MKNSGLTKSQIIQLSLLHFFKPRKRLGQNFLIDKNIVDKIVSVVFPKKEDIFLEIGAGFGALTIPIALMSKRVIAFEIDRKLYYILKEETRSLKNIEIVCQDFLKVNFHDFVKSKKIRIIGNLPYRISSLIIEKLIEAKEISKDIFIMAQKEFADRLIALPKSKEYSSITLFVNYHFLIKKLFTVKKTCFWPEPQVDSVFLKLKPRSPSPLIKARNEKLLFDIIRSAFGKRRKTILNGLISSNYRVFKKEQLEFAFKETGISSKARAEHLNLEDFVKLTNIISQL
jgi:16S rRNA (adenine1518-N6/adenine1519-N6)-dimethyltransferase